MQPPAPSTQPQQAAPPPPQLDAAPPQPQSAQQPGSNVTPFPGPFVVHLPPAMQRLFRWADMQNVADDDEIPQALLDRLATQVHNGYEIDERSRSEWLEMAEKATDCAEQKREPKNYPFPNSANIKYPLLAEAALQFNARAYPAIIQGRNICKARVGGLDPDGTKAARAQRVASYQNHQILDGMSSWEADMDLLLMQLPVIGSSFKKTFWDFDAGCPRTMWVSAFDLVVNQRTKHLSTCPRISHVFELYPYEIDARVRSGAFLDVPLDNDASGEQDEQSPVTLVEQHCYFDLDEDGLDEPWVVTIQESSGKLMRIRPGFDPQDIKYDSHGIHSIPRDNYFTHFRFLPNVRGGFYGMGFGQLLESINEVIDTSFNQMLDAGHLQNAGGGFIGRELNFRTSEFRFEPGKYFSVDAPGGVIRDSIVDKNFAGPSTVLFQLLGAIKEDARQMVAIQDILTGATTSADIQPTTLMALIDQGMKVFTAIYKRVFVALSEEFRIQYELNRRYLSDDDYAKYLGQPSTVAADFAEDGCIVNPVADPGEVTETQRITKAQFLASLVMQPAFQNLLEPLPILMRVLQAAEIDNVAEVLKKPAPPTPADQIQLATAQAQLAVAQSTAMHNKALAEKEMAQADHYSAKAASEIVGKQPDFLTSPVKP
jgi:chaperonin GroES